MRSDCRIDVSELIVANSDCVICALLLRAARPYLNGKEPPRHITRDKSALIFGYEGPRLLRLGIAPGQYIQGFSMC
jgi:hypothetical protein